MNVNTSIPSKRQASRRAGGFTLVELLVVISIMLLMLKLTLPSLRGLIGGNKHSVARSQLIGDLNRARTKALQNGAPVYMVFMPVLTNFNVMPTQSQIGHAAPAQRPNLESDRTIQIEMAKQYLFEEGNDLLGKQAVAYALYAEFLPGDQPNAPSNRWLTDWKRLPEGMYFAKKDLEDIWIMAAGSDQLAFNNLKNGHSRGATNSFGNFMNRQMLLPYLMFNREGELSARGVNGGIRGNNFFLSVTEGGVFQPEIENGENTYISADRPEVDSVTGMPKGRRTWVQINSITGHADVWEEGPGRVLPTKRFIDLEIEAVTIDYATILDMGAQVEGWRLKNARGHDVKHGPWDNLWEVAGPNGRRKRLIHAGAGPVRITGLPQNKAVGLMVLLRRIDPGIRVDSKRY